MIFFSYWELSNWGHVLMALSHQLFLDGKKGWT